VIAAIEKDNLLSKKLAFIAVVLRMNDANNEINLLDGYTADEEGILRKLKNFIVDNDLNSKRLIKQLEIDLTDQDTKDKAEVALNEHITALSTKEEEFMDGFLRDHGILSKHRKMLHIFRLMKRFSKNIEILITGETGTGKEGIARAIHRLSKRKGKFRAVNASTRSGDMFKDTLMGHIKGAYADAHESRIGEIELAHNGTLFLDEIGDIDVQVQSDLLRVLEEKIVQREGSPKVYSVNFRLVCATNKNISEQVKSGKMRDDFAARFASAVNIELPPIKDRLSDVPFLSHYFFIKELAILQNEDCNKITKMKEFKIEEKNQHADCKLDDLSFELIPEDFNILLERDWSQWNIRGIQNYIRKVATAVCSIFQDLRTLDRTSFLKLLNDPHADIEDLLNYSKYKSNQDYKLFDNVIKNNYNDSRAAKLSPYGRDAFISKINTVILKIGKDVSYKSNSIGEIIISINNGIINSDHTDLEDYIDHKLSQLVNANIIRTNKLYNKKEVGNVIKELKKNRSDLNSN
jgi:transcriptional regulator with PAS, ATPase and Fis domain